MVRNDGTKYPLGCYIRSSTARLNRRMTHSRVFRRSVTRDVRYFQERDEAGILRWYVDLAPGTRQSEPRPAVSRGLNLTENAEEHLVFNDLAGMAWADYANTEEEELAWERRTLTEVLVPDYGRRDGSNAEPVVTYGDWTGITRGLPEDLCTPFGRAPEKQ